MNGVNILAIDFEVAQNKITNDDLTKILDTSDEWIYTRTGIKQRRVVSDDVTSVDLGISAAKKVISRAKFNTENIDLIIAAASAPENIYPSVACLIQAAINAKNAACFDLKAACSGFIYSLNTARAFIKSGIYKNILIVACDTTTKFTDWTDRSSCVLFGDGAGAAIVNCDNNTDDIIAIDLFSDGSLGEYITLNYKGKACPLVDSDSDNNRSYINMKGRDVYKYVMTVVPDKIEALLESANLTTDDIDYFIPHQSNQRMIDALAQRLNIPDEKVISNIENYGNMSAASIPVAIREAIDSGKIKLPAKVLLSAFGAGMTCANAVLRIK